MTDHFSGAVTAPAERADPPKQPASGSKPRAETTDQGETLPFALGSRRAKIRLKEQEGSGVVGA